MKPPDFIMDVYWEKICDQFDEERRARQLMHRQKLGKVQRTSDLLKMRFVLGLTLKEIGTCYGLSERRIGGLIDKIAMKINRK